MSLTRIQVQEELYKRFTQKGYVTEEEIDRCCNDNNINIFDVDKIVQFLTDKKVLIENYNDLNKISLDNDDEEIYDKAQFNYGSFYDKIIDFYPHLQFLVDSIIKNKTSAKK